MLHVYILYSLPTRTCEQGYSITHGIGGCSSALHHVDHGTNHQPDDCNDGNNETHPVGVDEVERDSDEGVVLRALTTLCVCVCVCVCV